MNRRRALSASVMSGGGGGNLITFTIEGTEYQAEEGMTWEEWVDSEYNVIGAFIYYDLIFVGSEFIITSAYLSVQSNELILQGENYMVSHGGGSN